MKQENPHRLCSQELNRFRAANGGEFPEDLADTAWGSVGSPMMKDLKLPKALLKRFRWPKKAK